MSNFSIVGFWKFKTNRVKHEDGTWYSEDLAGGMMAFSPKGETCLMVRSEQGPWGYSGKYQFDGSKFTVLIAACTAGDIEGSSLERSVIFVSENELLFSGVESHTGRHFETVFLRT